MREAKGVAANSGQSGLTLIETLISILVFSIAMLGIAALQAAATRAQSGVWARGAVSVLVSDLSERMRANLDGINGVSVTTVGGTGSTSLLATGYEYVDTFAAQQVAIPAPAVDCNAAGAACTPAQRADFDMLIWRNLVRRSLPNGAVMVGGTALTGMDVTIMWLDKDFTARNTTNADDVALDDLSTTNTCPAAGAAASEAQRRFCCPTSAAVPAGVRCYNTVILP
jgi:type IV pilus assembly protein PilV